MEDESRVMWLGLPLPYVMLGRGSELLAYAKGQVHPAFCLTCNSLSFFRGDVLIVFENRSTSHTVQERLLASSNDQKRVGWTITRAPATGQQQGGRGGGVSAAFRAVLKLLGVHPQLAGKAPLTARFIPAS